MDLEIRPRRRLALDVSNRLWPDTPALRYDATEPLVVSYAGPAGIGAVEAVPEWETLSELEQLLFQPGVPARYRDITVRQEQTT